MIQTLVLRPFFLAGGKVKGIHRSFPIVQLARPKCKHAEQARTKASMPIFKVLVDVALGHVNSHCVLPVRVLHLPPSQTPDTAMATSTHWRARRGRRAMALAAADVVAVVGARAGDARRAIHAHVAESVRAICGGLKGEVVGRVRVV